MPGFQTATVAQITVERVGLQRLVVAMPDGEHSAAYALTEIIGPVAVGDSVIVNTTAVDLDLGTGGSHVVHWNLARDSWQRQGPGHVMKARYTSEQLDAGVYEEAADYQAPISLDGTPVIVCLLHSQMVAAAVAIKHLQPDARVGYVMTDQASLPAAISDVLHELRDRQLVDFTVTAGQAFGGDHEAVNTTSALGVARHLGADIIIVSQGPGVVGTDTRLGFSGLEAAEILTSAQRYGGQPLLALRWSDADARPRHRGMSHHSTTVLERTAVSVDVAIPASRADEVTRVGDHRFTQLGDIDIAKLFDTHDLRVTSMGRSASQDPGFFEFSAAAGSLAVRLAPHLGSR